MLARILDWSMRQRVLVITVWLAIAGASVFAALALPLDAFPDTTPVQVQVNTSVEALAPVEIERRVTAPVEAALVGLPGLVELRSVSKLGFSQVTATFDEHTAIADARQAVSERIVSIALEPGLERPTMGPAASGLGEVFQYLVHGTRSLAELRTIHDLQIRPRLARTAGVAEVNAWGGEEARLEVRLDPEKLRRQGLDVVSVSETLAASLGNVSGGPLALGGEAPIVQASGTPIDRDALAAMVIATHDGVGVPLGAVATIGDGHAIRHGAVTANGGGEVVLGIGFARLGANGHAVTEALHARLTDIARTLPAGVQVTPVYERTWLVDGVLDTAAHSLALGAALVIVVLLVGLRSLRAGLVVALVIPLSMLVAVDLMWLTGIAGSLMSLGAIDFGVLVDSAVIQVENVMASREERRDAILEVRGPTLYGELVIAAVFIPVLALEGIEGKLFRPMALTMLFALLGSLALSLTLVPALATFVPRHAPEPARAPARAYRALVGIALRHPTTVIVSAVLILGGAAYLTTTLGATFVPRLSEGTIVLNTVRLAGVDLDTSVAYGTRIERLLRGTYPTAIDQVWTRTGSAEITTDPMGLEVSDVFVTLRPREIWQSQFSSQEALVTSMTETMRMLPGMRTVFTQPIEMRINEMVAGIRADVGVILHGDDYAVLKERARAIQAVLEGIDGAVDVSTEQLTGQPLIEVRLDPVALGRHGVAQHEALTVVRALGGIPVGVMPKGEARVPIVATLDARYRESLDALGGVLLASANGHVRLDQVATLVRSETPASIQRDELRRRVIVEANVRDRDLAGFVAEAEARLANVALPEGYYLRIGGQHEHLERASKRLMIIVPIALALVLLLLGLAYRRVRDVLRVFIGVPFAAVGGVVALAARDMPFSISAGVGFVALAGVAVLGDMVLVSTIRKRLAEGVAVIEAVTQAATQRLRPVLMTALVASLGFVPMAIATGFGAEVQRPLATVVIGGVVSSTLATLLVLPTLYRVTARDRTPRAAATSPDLPPTPIAES